MIGSTSLMTPRFTAFFSENVKARTSYKGADRIDRKYRFSHKNNRLSLRSLVGNIPKRREMGICSRSGILPGFSLAPADTDLLEFHRQTPGGGLRIPQRKPRCDALPPISPGTARDFQRKCYRYSGDCARWSANLKQCLRSPARRGRSRVRRAENERSL